MELALEVKFYLDFHWVTRPWRRRLTNGSDVKYVFLRCYAAVIWGQSNERLGWFLSSLPQSTTARVKWCGWLQPRSQGLFDQLMPGSFPSPAPNPKRPWGEVGVTRLHVRGSLRSKRFTSTNRGSRRVFDWFWPRAIWFARGQNSANTRMIDAQRLLRRLRSRRTDWRSSICAKHYCYEILFDILGRAIFFSWRFFHTSQPALNQSHFARTLCPISSTYHVWPDHAGTQVPGPPGPLTQIDTDDQAGAVLDRWPSAARHLGAVAEHPVQDLQQYTIGLVGSLQPNNRIKRAGVPSQCCYRKSLLLSYGLYLLK